VIVVLAVEDRAVPVSKVPAVDIIDEPVAVVVDSIPGDFAGVPPRVRSQIGMADVDATVNDRNHHLRRAHGHLPGQRSIDIGTGPPASEALVRQPPEAAVEIERVVWFCAGRLNRAVWFNRGHLSPEGEHRCSVSPVGQGDKKLPRFAETPQDPGSGHCVG
jgi:hypothetical protein